MRYVSHSIPSTGQAYVVAILEAYSRAILANPVSLTQDTNARLSVLHAAIGRHGSPKVLVTAEGGISAPTGRRPSTGSWAWRSRI